MTMTIEICNKYRVCYADGEKALFHCWSQVSDIVIIKDTGEELGTNTYAIVELEDGTITRVKPEKIKFCDNYAQQYNYEKRN